MTEKEFCCAIFEIFWSHIKLYASNFVTNFQNFYSKIKVFAVQKPYKNGNFQKF